MSFLILGPTICSLLFIVCFFILHGNKKNTFQNQLILIS
ncbi:Hypothetical protein I595_1251 [Croceitalea dokdonensis DOKDO 023]|uniref:Uncharacterized protein n=1 Tax=Croceitalea dokdonensis DOKDO 023 TaxID=1300341 RepID=A0A0P7B1C3_9FLAO|nr:Hypothetical protein I595_1251 [Croceitalea dokdonensis DOKDO 023]